MAYEFLWRWTKGEFLASSSASEPPDKIKFKIFFPNKIKMKGLQFAARATKIRRKKKKKTQRGGKRKIVIPVRPRENLVMMVPVMAKPTRKGQLRFHSLLKKTGHGSNCLISATTHSLFSSFALLSLSLQVLYL